MNRILKKFLQRGVDLSPVGVELREDNTNYFCTPKGASVFGWAGIDGIHFCFIRGFGEMVFSVSPMNTSPDYVHPVAENFTDFLRLILACGDVAAVEQAWMWNEAQFEAFLNENPTTQEQQQTLSEISEKMNLLPMEQPWTYIKNLQSSFDYSQIKYTEDYYDNDMTSEAELVAPEWKVYFDGDFWGHRGKDRAGKEIKLDKQFDWAGYHWVIPAAYSCSKGLVVDFCMRVDSESIRDFMKKWNLDWENDSCENFTREQQMQMEWENPLCFNFKPCLKLNEKILQTTHGCAVSFNPCLPDGVINELEAKWAMQKFSDLFKVPEQFVKLGDKIVAIPMISKEQQKQEATEQKDFEMNADTSGLTVAGHIGTWHTIDRHEVGGHSFYLMEHDTYGDEAACIIVDERGKLVLDDVYNGFDDDTLRLLDLEVKEVPEMPDPTLSIQDMKDYGYAWAGVLPAGQETAEKALEKGCEVYRLYSDNTEGLCVDAKEIADHAAKGGMLGISKESWMAALEKENYLKAAEMSMEDDYGMIDGIINNGPKEDKTAEVKAPERGEKSSIMDRLKSAKAEKQKECCPPKKHKGEIEL